MDKFKRTFTDGQLTSRYLYGKSNEERAMSCELRRCYDLLDRAMEMADHYQYAQTCTFNGDAEFEEDGALAEKFIEEAQNG